VIIEARGRFLFWRGEIASFAGEDGDDERKRFIAKDAKICAKIAKKGSPPELFNNNLR
jgi:hypothetical protein